MSKVVLVTGAAYGIGYATAKCLLEDGATVYGADVRFKDLQRRQPVGMTPLKMDVRKPEEVKTGIEEILNESGRLDSLVANAGHICLGMVECVTAEDYMDQFEVNLFGVARCVQAALPTMRAQRQGTIVILSSVAGKISTPGMGWYCASKHAVEAYADALRMETKQFGIRVVLIEPGFVRTELLRFSQATLERSRTSPQGAIYQDDHDAFEANCSRAFYQGASPEKVAVVIKKAIHARRPKSRYQATPDAKFNLWAKRILEGNFFDNQVMRQFLKRTSQNQT